MRSTAIALAAFAACAAPAPDSESESLPPLPYDETQLIPGDTLLEKLGQVSQLDNLEETTGDYARCSAAATLSAYLLLGGEFARVASQHDVEGELTFGNVHRVQESLYHLANTDDHPGVFGGSVPRYDEQGRLTGWDRAEGDEYHVILEALELKPSRCYGPTKDAPNDKRAAVREMLADPRPVVFIVGVDEDMESESFAPMVETGNHYVAMFEHEGVFYALDSFRYTAKSALVRLSPAEVEANLFDTPNAIFAVRR